MKGTQPMDIRLLTSLDSKTWTRRLVTGLVMLSAATAAIEARAQQLVPFGDVPATDNFSEAEMATRGRKPDRPLTYAPWRKVCFRTTQVDGSKMVCRTTINGRWDSGQMALRMDLIEREGDPVGRFQIFVPPGSFLQSGIKLTIDQGPLMQIPYVLCLANGCVAGSAATVSMINELEKGETLMLETVNTNVVGVTNAIPLKGFAEAHLGAPAQIFEQRLEGDWEH
jgi:invasion protein IalB